MNTQTSHPPTIPEIRKALDESYAMLSRWSKKQRWEFNSNVYHIQRITKAVQDKTYTIVDIGCGIGILAIALKLLGYQKVYGADRDVFLSNTDYTVTEIDELKKIWDKMSITIVPSVDDLPAQADFVVSIAVIEHQPYPKEYFTSLKQVMKKGARIYIATPNISNFRNRIRVLIGRAPVVTLEKWYEESRNFVGHWHEYTLKELMRVCELGGLHVIDGESEQTHKSPFPKWFHRLTTSGDTISVIAENQK